jgi:ribosomal protein S24E
MKVTISQKTNNELLGRVEITGKVVFDKETPSNTQLAETLSKELKKAATLIVPKHIYTKFGHKEAEFTAFAYNDSEALNRSEKMTKHLRKKATETAKKAAEEKQAAKEAKTKEAEEKAAAAEKPVEEAPVEEPVVEKAEETKEKPETTPEETKEAEA